MQTLYVTNGLILSNKDHAIIASLSKSPYEIILVDNADVPTLETIVYFTKLDLNIDVPERTFSVVVHNFQHTLNFELKGSFEYSTDMIRGEQEVGLEDGLYISGMSIYFESDITMSDFSMEFQKEIRSTIETTVYEYLEK